MYLEPRSKRAVHFIRSVRLLYLDCCLVFMVTFFCRVLSVVHTDRPKRIPTEQGRTVTLAAVYLCTLYFGDIFENIIVAYDFLQYIRSS